MPSPLCVAPCRKTSSGTSPGIAEGIWITPSRPPLPRPSAPLFSEVTMARRGRAVRRAASSAGALVATRQASPRAADASAHPDVTAKRRRVTRLSATFLSIAASYYGR